MKFIKSALLAASALAFAASAADASSVTRLVLKASDAAAAGGSTVVDPYLDWINAGGVNEGVAGATSLANNGVDYKDSWVDSNWGLVDSVRVSMFTNSVEVAYLEFDAAGTTKENFFSLANLTSSSWTDIASEPRNFFSVAGSISNDRHFYVNRNWGGCSVDRGWFVVLDGTVSPGYVCNWEDTGAADLGTLSRGFMYSSLTTYQNFNDASIGIADVFAVTVSYDAAAIPLPASGLLLAGGVGALALRKRRKAA